MVKESELKKNDNNSSNSTKTNFSKLFSQNRSDELSNIIKDELNDSLLSIGSEKKSEESNDNYRSFVELSTDWIWEVNKWYQFTYTNQAVQQCLGYSPRDLKRKYLYDFINKKHLVRLTEYLTNKSCEGSIKFETEFIHRDGSTVLFETNCASVLDEAGNTIGYQGICRIQTHYKESK